MRIAMVVPRYGEQVLGGAESQARGFAETAVQRGWEVEVWTTCARSHYTWENIYPAGVEDENGVIIRRFPVEAWKRERWVELEIRLAQKGCLSPAEAYDWLDSGPHSPALYDYIKRNSANYDVIIALPYPVPLIHYAAWSAESRVILWPCLHDEPYAYLEPVRLLLESVWGTMFFSPEEARLAIHRLQVHLHRFTILGAGICPTFEANIDPQGERLNDYILYAGRLEEGKNVPLLYEYMGHYSEEKGRIRLVVIGEGPIKPPRHPAFVYLGFVSERKKATLYRGALALCQPSLRESFSITIMEAWLAGRPVLVYEDCPVTKGHVQRSKGGLRFRTYEDFAGVLDWLQAHPELAARMGENGRRYVLSNYTWDVILDRFEKILQDWKGT
jgi:glycosyltransferase involved in cell wall biosynthesis